MAVDRLRRLSAYVPFVEHHYTKNLTLLRTFVVEAKMTGLDQRQPFSTTADWAGHNLHEDCVKFLAIGDEPNTPSRINKFDRARDLVRRVVDWRANKLADEIT